MSTYSENSISEPLINNSSLTVAHQPAKTGQLIPTVQINENNRIESGKKIC